MPAPTEHSETDATNSPSAGSDVDETVAASGASASGAAAVLGFAPPTVAGEVGTLGPYRVIKELGRGGMGAVYAAIDTRLERQLALKVMLPQFAADASAKERFLREARAAAKISHDNVVTVYEADERNGVPYIAMQFLEGLPLDEYLKKKGLPTIPQVLRIAAETAAGLAAAHKIGLVHRDIKPANLWLEAPNGRVKVLDFGLAKPVDSEFELTKSGAVVGTPAYMSPEQARGEKVDHRTDLFSLGAVLYRLCVGKLPFSGPTTMAVLMALGTEEPPQVRAVNPTVPEALAALIHQLLSKQADARPQSAAEVVKRVRAIAESLATPRGPSAELSTSQAQVMQPQVVYAVMPVTAAPEASPFAELEASSAEVTSRESNEEPTAAPTPVGKKPRGKGPWVAAGLSLLLAAAVVTGVIIVIKNKDGTETKIAAPDPGKGNKTPPEGPKPQPAADTSVDRKVAEWVIAQNASVRVNGADKDITTAAELPKERFTLTLVNLSGMKVADAGLATLKDLKGLTDLDLHSTTGVSDAGLAHLKEFKALTQLLLSGTQLGDAGLEHLKELQSLTFLDLRDTKVTAKGLQVFHAALPTCKILHDGGVINAVDVDRKAAEYVLSVSGVVRVNGEERWIKAAAELPKGSFSLTGALLADNKAFTDAGLANLKDCKNLTLLILNRTQVTDVGLAHLKDCKNLSGLSLDNTQVTDAGLAHLKECKNLTNLFAKGTKVTAKGLAEFHAVVPGCKVEHDGGVIEAVDVDRKAAEWVIAQGGSVGVNGRNKEIKAAAELPGGRFGLNAVILAGNKQATDEGMAHLKDLKGLTNLDLCFTQVTDGGMAHLKDLKGLTNLGLAGTKVTDEGLAHFKGCTGLTYLNLGGLKVTDTGLAHFKDCKGLTFLHLDDTMVTDAGLASFQECKGLIHLTVMGTKVTAKGLAAFHAAVPGCKIEHDGGIIEPKPDVDRKAAEMVIAQGGGVRVNGVDKEIKGAADLPKERFTLTWVGLSGTKVADDDLVHLKHCNGLTTLELLATPISDLGLVHLKELKSLNAIVLYGTKVSDAGLVHLKDLNGLTSVNLGFTQVSDAGLAHLKDAKGLTHLVLHDTAVSDAGLAHLKGLKSLTVLNLANTKVSDAGVEYLKELKGLTSLRLVKTGVTAKGLETLHAALPACGIEHDGGTIEPKAAPDPDRTAAQWVIARGGAIQVNGDERSITKAGELPPNSFKLTHAHLIGAKQVLDEDLAQFRGLKNLKNLNLYNTPVSDDALVHLKGLGELTDLVLYGSPVTDKGLDHLKELKTLTRLELRKTAVTAKGLEALRAALPACKITHDGGTIEPKVVADADRKAAEWVLAQGGTVGISGDMRTIKAAAELPKEQFTLTSLSLQNKSKVTDTDLARFKDCKTLTILDLQRTQATDAGLAHFKDHKTLRVLYLNGTKVTDDGLVHLKGYNALRDLSLADTALTGAGLAHLKDCKELETLLLSDTALTDAELAHLKDYKALKALSLNGTKVTDDGLTHLKDCKALTGLDLRKTKVTAKGLEEFHAVLPGCQITHDGGTIKAKK